ncbi:DNA-binding protein [Actinoplanes philippinensis]|uniref:Helix-turn-helix domain-containing protein n=1 Tax=Actinoplanes philippinensis TaxID=35752 RepID=A0A1I2HIK9_9ACTN|nr:helix-turn-helix transcriptional regulator [Actinoplanes philippinensis]GIE82958.1 DNA-binding protein [Actinoplanes philippinensis]SFF29539.1 Helix-turn-helix domain-containing protein [Actinoplanes philippinensis]
MDRALLADFLRARREALQPEDAGLPRGSRRRTGGLRREEVAALAGMSADYYSRIEQQRGPAPSEPIIAALATALQLSPGEREHLFALSGHSAPRRVRRDVRASPAMSLIIERLADVPAIVLSRFGEALLQTGPAVALLGDYTRFTGMSRYLAYRWFTDPAQRALYPPEDHATRARVFTAELRAAYTADPAGTAGEIVEALLAVSPAFAEVWRRHEVDVTHHNDLKRYRHPEEGELELYARRLVDPDEDQELLVFTAAPGSPSEAKLQRLIQGRIVRG